MHSSGYHSSSYALRPCAALQDHNERNHWRWEVCVKETTREAWASVNQQKEEEEETKKRNLRAKKMAPPTTAIAMNTNEFDEEPEEPDPLLSSSGMKA